MDTSVCTLDHRESQQLLKTAINRKLATILSYLSKNKWHVAKVYLLNVDADRLWMESMHPETRRRPLNIQTDQPVGVSFKLMIRPAAV